MDLEQKSIERIQFASEMSLHHYGKPLICTYSGGKDSDVMLELFRRSGVPFEVHHSHTTADAPQTVRHIQEIFRKLELQGIHCEIQMPTYKGERTSMWKLIPQNSIPPTRRVRYCCGILKETGCENRFIAQGVRWDESIKRREWGEISAPKKRLHVSVESIMSDNEYSRRVTEMCTLKNKMAVNPIVDWTHNDIWNFIQSEQIEVCALYQCGYDRVGCIGCPMAGRKGRLKGFADFPTYKRAYIRAFSKMLEIITTKGKPTKWKSGEDVFNWWVEDKNIDGQISLDLEEN